MDGTTITRSSYGPIETMVMPERNARNASERRAEGKDLAGKGDSVSISDAARELLRAAEGTPSADQRPGAVMTAMTELGTTVTVEASSLERTTFSMGGQLARKNLFNLTSGASSAAAEMAFSVTFAHADGQKQTFELGGNAVFRELQDGTILMDSRQGTGSSTLTGTDGNEIFIAIEDGTEVQAGNGNNRIFNMARDTRLITGDGNDIIASLADGARIESGAGNDAVVLLQDTLRPVAPGSLNEAMADDPENRRKDHRTRGAQTVEVDAGEGDNLIAAGADLFKGFIRSGEGEDTVRLRDATSTRINLGGGNDDFSGDELFYSTLDGGAGDDTLLAHTVRGGGIAGGGGNDRITVASLIDAFMDGGDGDDILKVTTARGSAISGGAGDDEMLIDTLVDSLVDGGSGNDSIRVGVSVNSRIEGGGGYDVLQTGQADSANTVKDEDVAAFMAARTLEGNAPTPDSQPLVAVGPGGSRRVVSGRP